MAFAIGSRAECGRQRSPNRGSNPTKLHGRVRHAFLPPSQEGGSRGMALGIRSCVDVGQRSPNRGNNPTKLHGRERASSCARNSFSHAVLQAEVEPGSAKMKV